MQNAQLISLSRQIALQRQMDVVANNLANINTTGFKASNLLFEDYLMPGAQDNSFDGSDRDLHFTEDWSTTNNMSAGAIAQTDDPLNVAINGEGFLAVQTPNGERYTRNGAFTLDATGTLVDLNGNPVLTEAGPVQFGSRDTEINIAPNGAITTSNGSKGKLKLVEFDDPQVLAREGDNYYSGPTGNPATKSRLTQGAVEHSNVSGVAEMASMIRVTRAYQTLANIIQRTDELRTTAIQRLGEVAA